MAPSMQTVLVTGFGIFGDYEVNSSWVAVKELSAMGLGVDNFKLEIKEIPVEYDTIDKKVPHLWKKYNPVLVVHVGVSGIARTLTLEQLAHNNGYTKRDVKGKCPKNHCSKENGPAFLKSTINMQTIVESAKVKECGINMAISQDPGRFCCDYIYYTSLSMKTNDVVFIHVPPLNQPFNGKTLALGLRAVIQAILERVNNSES